MPSPIGCPIIEWFEKMYSIVSFTVEMFEAKLRKLCGRMYVNEFLKVINSVI